MHSANLTWHGTLQMIWRKKEGYPSRVPQGCWIPRLMQHVLLHIVRECSNQIGFQIWVEKSTDFQRFSSFVFWIVCLPGPYRIRGTYNDYMVYQFTFFPCKYMSLPLTTINIYANHGTSMFHIDYNLPSFTIYYDLAILNTMIYHWFYHKYSILIFHTYSIHIPYMFHTCSIFFHKRAIDVP